VKFDASHFLASAWQNGKNRVKIKVPEGGLVVMEREM
jgi:hypothetical protein